MGIKIDNYSLTNLTNIVITINKRLKLFSVLLAMLLILYFIIINNKAIISDIFMWTFICVMLFIIVLFIIEFVYLSIFIIKNKYSIKESINYYNKLINIFKNEII